MIELIDPNLSVYHLLNRSQEHQKVLNHRRTMSAISREIENASLLDNAVGRIFSGFQVMSKFIPQMERYRRLAAKSEGVYVFGVMDIIPPPIPNLTYVSLKPDDQLAREWFLVSYGKDYQTVLATEELTHISQPDDDRIFRGILTFDPDLAEILQDWFSSILDVMPYSLPVEGIHYETSNRLMEQTMQRLLASAADKTRKPTDTQEMVQNEIRSVIKSHVHPELIERSSEYAEEAGKNREAEAVILYTDLRNFTSLSERLSPMVLVQDVMNPYFKAVSRAVARYGGVIDKFIGDAVLAVFMLEDTRSSVDAAYAAAQEILRTVQSQNTYAVGIGLAYGTVMVGEIGTEIYHERTVIGDPVNLASRLSSLGSNEIWLSYTVFEQLTATHELEPCGAVNIKGKAQPHEVYRRRLA